MESGDIVWVDFDPAFGHEQSGRRPALVVSTGPYNAKSSMVIVCPITQSQRTWPFHVPIDNGGTIRGSIIVDQIKAIDKRRVASNTVETISDATLAIVRETFAAITFGAEPH